MYKGKKIGVVVPAYNEEGFVGDVIKTVPKYVDRVYIIDDCSTDGTWDEIRSATQDVNKKYSDGCESALVINKRHDRNKGVGASIKTGYRQAADDGIDVIAVMAGDGQMDPDILDRIIDPVVENQASYSKGNRLINSNFWRGMSSWRLFGNSILTLLTKIATGYWKMMDPQNGYTAITKEAIEKIPLEDVYDGYGFSNDILVKLNVYGFRIADVSMEAKYDDETSHINYRTFIPVLSWLLLKNFIWRMKVKNLIKDFHPLSIFYLVGIFLSLAGVGLGSWSIFERVTRNHPLFIQGSMSLIILALGITLILFAMLFDMQANEGSEIRNYSQ